MKKKIVRENAGARPHGHWPKTKAGRILRASIISAMLLLILVLCFLFLSPKPLFYVFLRNGNPVKIPDSYAPPADFETIQKKSVLYTDNTYASRYEDSTYDIYLPIGIENPPVFVFFHGGGFVLGDKQMAVYYGPALAAEGYAVLSVNYRLVPSTTLLNQTKQVMDFFVSLPDIIRQHNLDIDNIFVAGSSAGGYLAARAVTVLYNAGYARQLGLEPPPGLSIRGLILYSAPFEISAVQPIDAGGLLRNLALYEMGWAITGSRTWRSDPDIAADYDLYAHITPDMPPLFISDGNHNSFTEQAKKYAEEARVAGLAVEELFFDGSADVGHGYQMDMGSREGEIAFAKMLDFLTKYRR